MTVQLKNSVVKKAISSIVNTGNDALTGHESPITLNIRGMVIDLEDGTVTLKFKPNKSFGEPSKPAKQPKENPAFDVDTSIKFERGEKAGLKATFKENIIDYKEKGVLAKQFGANISIKDVPFMIVGFENGKFLCRNVKQRDVKKPLRATLDAFEEALTTKPVKGTKLPKVKADSKQSAKFSVKPIVLKQGPKEEKFKKAETTNLERKFGIAAGKLKKDGIKSSWFFKVVTVKNKRLRLIKLSSTRKQFVVINVDTGKKLKLDISELLPL